MCSLQQFEKRIKRSGLIYKFLESVWMKEYNKSEILLIVFMEELVVVKGIVQDMMKGFETAYIDGSVASSLAHRPQFVSNNYKKGKKVLSSIEEELLKCDHFQISVAFITINLKEKLR